MYALEHLNHWFDSTGGSERAIPGEYERAIAVSPALEADRKDQNIN